MKTLLFSLKPQLLLLALGIFVFASTTNMACSPKFDQMGVDNVKNISTKVTGLMGKATGPYNEPAAADLLSDLDKAQAHAAGIKGNKSIAESWKVLKDDLVAPFLMKWKEKGKLDAPFVKEATAQVVKSLDAIKKAEMGKKK